jgi:putative addiction module component (TIGR02574 family)
MATGSRLDWVPMATTAIKDLLEAALALPSEQRAELAHELLDSLHEFDQDAWQAAWTDELDRRVAEVRSGQAQLIDGDEAMRRVRARIESPSK